MGGGRLPLLALDNGQAFDLWWVGGTKAGGWMLWLHGSVGGWWFCGGCSVGVDDAVEGEWGVDDVMGN